MCSDFGHEIFVHSDFGTAKKVIGPLIYVARYMNTEFLMSEMRLKYTYQVIKLLFPREPL